MRVHRNGVSALQCSRKEWVVPVGEKLALELERDIAVRILDGDEYVLADAIRGYLALPDQQALAGIRALLK